MKVIIAGSRGITDPGVVADAMDHHILTHGWPTTILSGTARGVDRLGERWAKYRDMPIERHPAQWDKYGRSAGYRRNEEMAEAADGLVAIWDGSSQGTKHMIDLARKHGLAVTVWTAKERE